MENAIAFISFLSAGLILWIKSAGASFTVDQAAFYDEGDIDTLARTIWGEARGDGNTGMQAVACVILNRYKAAEASLAKSRQFGADITAICKKPYQFSCWLASDPNLAKILAVNTSTDSFASAVSIAKGVLSGSLPDITNGANHYHTSSVSPSWSSGATAVAVIGSHEFYSLA